MNIIANLINYIKMKLRGEVPTNILKRNGCKIGTNFKRLPGAVIDPSHCWLISIGNDVTLAPRCRILAHDASTKTYLGYSKIGLVEIGNNVFVGAESVILQGTKIGDNVIIGAGSVVTKDIPSGYVVAGNPAKIICKTDRYIEKNKNLIDNDNTFDYTYTVRHNINKNMKNNMIERLKIKNIGYVE